MSAKNKVKARRTSLLFSCWPITLRSSLKPSGVTSDNLMTMLDDKYRPRQLEEIDDNGVSILNQPIMPDNVSTLARAKERSLHAMLCEALTNTKALLERLERGVVVPRDQQREVVRLLYVATRHQVEALAVVLELEGLE